MYDKKLAKKLKKILQENDGNKMKACLLYTSDAADE